MFFALLVDDRINRDGGLAGLTVTDDQLALATTDGTMASTDLRPVCTGWDTDLRQITPGATFSIGSDSLALIGPLPSIGWPRELTTRPISSGPTGTSRMRPCALDGVAFEMPSYSRREHGADRVALKVHGEAERRCRGIPAFRPAWHRKAVNTADTVGH